MAAIVMWDLPWKFLILYFLLIILYFLLFKIYAPGPYEESARSALFKCLPMLYLIFLVARCHAISGEHSHLKKYIIAGLVASVCGDFFLNWMKKMFVPGILCFGAAHMLYIQAFGIQPFQWNTGSVFGFFALMIGLYITSGIRTRKDAVFDLKPLVGAYILVIHVMGWRAYVYWDLHREKAGSLMVLAGALMFMLSDFLIAVNMWKARFKRPMLWIMTTYYLAQFMIGMGVILPSNTVYKPPVQFFGV